MPCIWWESRDINFGKINLLDIITPAIPSITARVPGKASDRTLGKNRPVTLLWLGSSAKTKEGIPIVRPAINVRCLGSKGSSKLTSIINSIAMQSE